MPSARRSPLTAHCSLLLARMLASSIHKVGNYLREELYVGMGDSTVRKVFQKVGLKCTVT